MCCQDTSTIETVCDPFNESLWGEYARMLLVGMAGCSAAVWSIRLAGEPVAVAMVVSNLLILGIAIGCRFAGLPRLFALMLLAIATVTTATLLESPTRWWEPVPMLSPAVTVVALIVLMFRDGMIAFRNHAHSLTPRKLVLVSGLLTAAIYMVVIPSVDVFLDQFRERPQSFTVEDLSAMEVLRIRSAKMAVFAIFAYAGACVGSFLNVVAASAPRGESIALRSSACPKCNTPIRRIDNLPIISYLLLRGRCRNCDVAIPIRYFVVEMAGLAIFASLFLFELVTGAANIPGFHRYHFAGILWIILYTKWPVVGVYLFHCAMLISVLMLALMEQDRLQPPRWMKVMLPAVFAGVAVALPAMLTVSLADQTPLRFPPQFPDWLDRALASLSGGAAGAMIGYAAKKISLRRRQSSSSLPFGFALLGIAMGWQAVLTITAFWLTAIALLKQVRRHAGRRWIHPRWLTATTLLFAVAMLHHPAWKWLAERLSL
jgi:leader peptidase (prepilin peptidase)/N-methyltransferase